jgi:hypothetical protein
MKAGTPGLPEARITQLEASVITPLQAGISRLGKSPVDPAAVSAMYESVVDTIGSFTAGVAPATHDALQNAGLLAKEGIVILHTLAAPKAERLAIVRDGLENFAARTEAYAVVEIKGAPLQPDALTAAENNLLESGVRAPLRAASKQLAGNNPDLELITGRLSGVPAVLRTFTRFPEIARLAGNVELALAILNTLKGTTKEALANVSSNWANAVSLLRSIPALPAQETGEAAPEGGLVIPATAGM